MMPGRRILAVVMIAGKVVEVISTSGTVALAGRSGGDFIVSPPVTTVVVVVALEVLPQPAIVSQ
jgi:hypothetical protein